MKKTNLGYGLIGLGNIGRLHLMALKNFPIWGFCPEGKIKFSGLLSTQADKKRDLAKEIGFPIITTNLNDFLNLPNLDVVDICTPNFLHREQALAAAKKGKYIYCEKPLALNLSEAEEIFSEVKNKSLHHQLPFVLRFLPAVGKARALLNSGIAGQVYRVKAELFHSGYLDPSRPFAWRLENKSSGGGALFDLGSHLIDLLQFLFGDFKKIWAETKTIIKKPSDKSGKIHKVDVDDWAYLSLSNQESINFSLEVSRLAVWNEGFRLYIYGSKGALQVENKQPLTPFFFDPKGKQIDLEKQAKDNYTDFLEKCYPPSRLSGGWLLDTHAASLAWFFRNLYKDEKRPETPDFASGLKVQRTLDLAYRSAQSGGKPISF